MKKKEDCKTAGSLRLRSGHHHFADHHVRLLDGRRRPSLMICFGAGTTELRKLRIPNPNPKTGFYREDLGQVSGRQMFYLQLVDTLRNYSIVLHALHCSREAGEIDNQIKAAEAACKAAPAN